MKRGLEAIDDVLGAVVLDPNEGPRAAWTIEATITGDRLPAAAVQALRSAVELALDRGHTEVREPDIDDCFARANERIRKQQLESLGLQHQLVYRAIREHGPLCPTAIHEHYQALGGSKSRTATLKYRKKLDEYDLIEQTVDGWVAVDEALAAPRRQERLV